MKNQHLDITAHLDISSPEGRFQVSGNNSSINVSFTEWSTLFSIFKVLRRLERTRHKLLDLNWLDEIQGKIVLKGWEIAIVRLNKADVSRLLSFKNVTLRPVNIISALVRPQ